MNILAEIVAQSGTISEAHSVLFAYGPMGVMLAWFMWLSKKMADNLITIVHEHGAKFDNVIHKLNGLRTALLLNTISNDKISDFVRKTCEEELARANANPSKEKP